MSSATSATWLLSIACSEIPVLCPTSAPKRQRFGCCCVRPAPGSSEPSQKRETHLLQSKFACVTRSFIPSRIFLSREPWRSRASNMVECVVEEVFLAELRCCDEES